VTTWRHFKPKTVKAWDIEALAARDREPTTEHNAVSILGPISAPWRRREKCLPSEAQVGDFAMLDGRAHRITAIVPGWRSSRPRYELQDVACPDMPRHRVAWSEIEKLARATDSGELANLPAKDRGDRSNRPIA